MIEVALVFDQEGKPLFWLGPNGCSAGATEDSHVLWQRIWDNRENLGGVAHTHPWVGHPSPSVTDITTWHAIERALGKRLVWPIVTMDQMTCFKRFERKDSDTYYQAVAWEHRYSTTWLNNVLEMRRLSQGG